MTKLPPPQAIPGSGPSRHLGLERWHRWSLYGVCACLLVSGALFLFGAWLWPAGSPFDETLHPIKGASMKVHGAAAMAFLFLAGSLLHGHMLRALRSRRNLLLGWTLLGAMLVLLVSGYGLYYFTGESLREACSSLHWMVGLGWVAVFLAHVRVGRRGSRDR